MWNLAFFRFHLHTNCLSHLTNDFIGWNTYILGNTVIFKRVFAGVLYQLVQVFLQVFNVTLLLLWGFFNTTKFQLQRSNIALNGMAPSYICDLLQVHQPNRNLRSASRGLSLVVPPHQTQAYGARSFSVASPTLWNFLPVDIKNAQSLLIF